MKVIVKANDGIDLEFDTKDVTILVMLTAYDADKLRSMPAGQGANYCVHPDRVDNTATQQWMQDRIGDIVKKEGEQKNKSSQSGGPLPMPSPN